MNSERLLALFDRVSEAPDAVPKLRRFLLDLAVPENAAAEWTSRRG